MFYLKDISMFRTLFFIITQFSKGVSCGTVSNAFLKSTKATVFLRYKTVILVLPQKGATAEERTKRALTLHLPNHLKNLI